MTKLFRISDKPMVIAGPCSVESHEQLQEVCAALASDPRVGMIRCGVWKPRTRPGGFEGLGEEALRWMDEERREHAGMRFCCEVAKPEHVEMCAEHGVDAVWIGARTSGNPFQMTELSRALRGSGMGVMVKNPTVPDVEAWIGAIERLTAAGIDDVAAVHRGFATYNTAGVRNAPLWEIPIELKRRMPELSLLCDPSHIGGRSELVAELSQTALDMHMDGLMIECHPSPALALTDSRQQVTPSELRKLLDRLRVRTLGSTAPDELEGLRKQIDAIDVELLRLLRERMAVSEKIGELKARHNMTIFQPSRWQEVLENLIAEGISIGLHPDFVKVIAEEIHKESIKVQKY